MLTATSVTQETKNSRVDLSYCFVSVTFVNKSVALREYCKASSRRPVHPPLP